MDNSFEFWPSHDGLLLVEGWARDGLTEDQIAHNMGIHRSTPFGNVQTVPSTLVFEFGDSSGK